MFSQAVTVTAKVGIIDLHFISTIYFSEHASVTSETSAAHRGAEVHMKLFCLQLELDSEREEKESIRKERDALMAEKSEWERERTVLMKQLSSVTKCPCGINGMTMGKEVQGNFFSKGQVDFLLCGSPVTRWSEDAVGRAITLRSLSPKAYKYLREKYKFPLPSVTTLNRWAAKFNVEPGILNSVLSLLGSKSEALREIERLSILSFDETSLSYEWTYDKGKDILYNPKKKVQCVMLRGLCGNWKQLIYYNFDQDTTKDILFKLYCSC